MDPNLILQAFDDFDELRMQRLDIAQKFVSQYTENPDLLLADVANILMLLYAANKLAKGQRLQHKGFRSDTK